MAANRLTLLILATIGAAALGMLPAQVRASCGDYVMFGGHDAHHGQADSHPPAGSHESSAPGHCPCRGAECSQSPSPLPAPLPVRVDNVRDKMLTAFSASPGSMRPTGYLSVEPESLAPSFSPADIFRPPRQVA